MSLKRKVTLYTSPDQVRNMLRTCPNAMLIYAWVCAQCRYVNEEYYTIQPGMINSELGLSRKQYRLAIDYLKKHSITVCESSASGTTIWANHEEGVKAQQLALLNEGSNDNEGQGKGQGKGVVKVSEEKLREKYKAWLDWFNQTLLHYKVNKQYKFDDKAFNHYKRNLKNKSFSGEEYGKALQNAVKDPWLISVDHNPLSPEYFLRSEITNKYLNLSIKEE